MGSTPTWAWWVQGQKVAIWTSIPSNVPSPGRPCINRWMVSITSGGTTYKFINNKLYLMYNTICSLKSYCECGEIGRHKRLKISRPKWRAGSIPATRTKFRAFSSCWLEQWTHNPLVVCSTHTGPTKILTDILESWVSGWNHLPAKKTIRHKPGPRVRIPHSPPRTFCLISR